jgi:hypothetical protein
MAKNDNIASSSPVIMEVRIEEPCALLDKEYLDYVSLLAQWLLWLALSYLYVLSLVLQQIAYRSIPALIRHFQQGIKDNHIIGRRFR